MKIALILLGVLAVLGILYVLSLTPRLRRPEKQLERLRAFRYAHRGLHGEKVPENSLAAFRRAAELGFGVELDVRLTKDRKLVVIHDSDLRRMCGSEGKVEKLTWEDLEKLRLQGSQERIPLLDEVLPILCGRSPAIIEIKTTMKNCRDLCRLLTRRLESYRGAFCLESFDPRALRWLKKNEPFLVRGQLSENFLKRPNEMQMPGILWVGLTLLMGNFLGRPDFVAFRWTDRRGNPGLWLCRKLYHVPEFSWTVTSREVMAEAEEQDCTVIFESFLPEECRRPAREAAAPETAEA